MPPVTGSNETRDPDVDPGLATGRRQRIRRHIIARQHQQPPDSYPFDLDGFHPTLHLAVKVDFDVSNALQIDPLGLMQPASTVTVFGPLHAVEPVRTLESRIPRLDSRLSSLDPPEESGERPIEAA
jgi:hypothetical protein